MRKWRAKKLTGILAAVSMMAAAMTSQSVMADAEKVVTLGVDLSEEDQNKILKYFGVLGQDIRTIYVNNQDERDLLSSYIPLSVIGSRTLSCAYVKPTNSGGIQVKTANLNWVTSNMIASALSTSGVKNCEVIAACPREVSGTGALTGVLKAYEFAASSALSPAKKQVAAQEIATVSNVADLVGQTEATQIVNEIKIQIIEEEVEADDTERIQEIVDIAVDNAVAEMQAALDEVTDLVSGMTGREALEALAESIAEQKYDYDDVKETLERVEKNVEELKEKENGGVNVNVNIDNQAAGGSSSAEGGNASAAGGSSEAAGGSSEAAGGNADVTGANAEAAGGSSEAAGGSSEAAGGSSEADASDVTGASELSEDSILLNTDDSALGDDVIMDATTEEAVQPVEEAAEVSEPAEETAEVSEPAEETAPVQEPAPAEGGNDDDLFDITTTDEGSFDENADPVAADANVSGEQIDEEPTDLQSADEGRTDEQLFDEGLTDETVYEEPVGESQTDEQPADEGQTDEQVFDEGQTDEQLFDEGQTDEQLFDEGQTDEQLFDEGQTDEQVFDEGQTDEQVFDEGQTDEQVFDEGQTDEQLFDEGQTDEQVFEEFTDETTDDLAADEDVQAEDDLDQDGGVEAEENEEDVIDEMPEEPAAAAPQLSVGYEEDMTFNAFSLKLYAEGSVTPVSGTVVITDADGNEAGRISLDGGDTYGVKAVKSDAVKTSLGFDKATAIHVLTGGLALTEGKYNVSAEIVFADSDGNELGASSAEGTITYVPGLLHPEDASIDTFTAPSEAVFYIEGDVEAISSIEASSSDEGVAVPGYTDPESGTVSFELQDAGKAELSVTCYDEEGNALGSGSLKITVF